MTSLSKTQIETLSKMTKGIWYSAYGLQVSLNTLDALNRKNILKRNSGLGNIYSPRTSIQFTVKGI